MQATKDEHTCVVNMVYGMWFSMLKDLRGISGNRMYNYVQFLKPRRSQKQVSAQIHMIQDMIAQSIFHCHIEMYRLGLRKKATSADIVETMDTTQT
jgi:hypothetical protein